MRRWGRLRNGWSNGSGTASARSWSSAPAGSWLWSRGEELVTDRFPELAAMGETLPDGTVLDGEIVVWREGRVQPFAELQKRIGRKTLSPKLLREIPAVLLAYDLLEWEGRDLRALPQAERRVLLERSADATRSILR